MARSSPSEPRLAGLGQDSGAVPDSGSAATEQFDAELAEVVPRMGHRRALVQYVARRLSLAALTVFGATMAAFAIVRLVPGDPVATLLGPDSTAEQRASLRSSLGLDRALPFQYAEWLGRVLHGDFGTSIAQQAPVSQVIGSALPYTVSLSLAALALAIVCGFFLGWASATLTWLRGPLNLLISVLISLPQYTVAIILLALFSVDLRWLPSGGLPSSGAWPVSGDWFAHAVLPAVTLALAQVALLARSLRSALSQLRDGDLALAMQARGLSRVATARHLVHNAMPTVLVVLGLSVGFLFGGAVFVELIFNWPGLGLALYQAVGQRDYPVIQAGFLVTTVIVILVNLLVDLLNAVLDPRIRVGAS